MLSKGVFVVGLGVVRHDSNCADTDLPYRLGLRNNAINGGLHIGTVIADEDDERSGRAWISFRLMKLTTLPMRCP